MDYDPQWTIQSAFDEEPIGRNEEGQMRVWVSGYDRKGRQQIGFVGRKGCSQELVSFCRRTGLGFFELAQLICIIE